MTKKRRTKLKKIKKNSDGINLCRWCKNPVKPPKRTFCSSVCIHEYKIRSDTKYARDFVYERDLGQCSRCGVDTRYMKIEIENLRRSVNSGIDSFKKNPSYVEFCKKFGLTVGESLKSVWHMDHKKPVFKGGGECGLDNLVTLCVLCHKAKTKEDRLKK